MLFRSPGVRRARCLTAAACGSGARAEQDGGGKLCARGGEGKEEEGNGRRGKELTSSLLFIPSGATARSHDLLRTIGVDRGLTAPRSAA